MKVISKSKIDWCTHVWNYVVGCETGCPYCYARAYMKRFWRAFYNIEVKRLKESIKCGLNKHVIKTDLELFKPIFLVNKYEREFPNKPAIIFVNPFSDIKWWSSLWLQMAIDRIRENPQHKFVFLTKYPESYFNVMFPENCWLGITETNNNDVNKHATFFQRYKYKNKIFLSLEPLQSEIDDFYIELYDWVIIGAETGNRKEKVMPKKWWVLDIITTCKKNNIPVFLKENIKQIWDGEMIQEYPKPLCKLVR